MTSKEFDRFLEQFLGRIRETLSRKADEYARTDRFHNFNRAAMLQRTLRERALEGMMTKQIVSIYDLLDDLEKPGPVADLEVWEEKITDTVCYLTLLLGMRKQTSSISERICLDDTQRSL